MYFKMNFGATSILLFSIVDFCLSSEPRVTISLGTINGVQLNVDEKSVNEFLGIPFAEPPVGELRFKKPRPLTEKWTNAFDTKKWPNMCVQMKSDFMSQSAPQSEDCLYLNVWSPVSDSAELKSVMVFIHGGAFSMLSSSFALFNGSVLSAMGDVVVVTINYRLGALGFLYGGNDEMPGNVGLYDQSLALEWVQENIAYFGGDKNKVTIFGISAGAMSVAYHVLSPVSRLLFKNAIVMSGVARENVLTDSVGTATKLRNHFAKIVGCEASESETVVSESTLKCLRELSPESFVNKELENMNSIKLAQFQSWFFPVFGENFIPKDPRLLLNEKRFNRHINVLIGTVPHEAIAEDIFNTTVNVQQWIDRLRSKLDFSNSSKRKVDIDHLIDFYFAGISETDETKSREAYYKLMDDFYFNCPTIEFAEKVSAVNNVFHYLLDFAARNRFFPCPEKRLCHGEDTLYTFGILNDSENVQLNSIWIKIITDFAKNGAVNWPKYSTTKSGVFLPFYKRIGNTENESEMDFGYRHFPCKVMDSILFSKTF